MLEIILADAKQLVRSAVGAHLLAHPGIAILEAESLHQALSRISAHQEAEVMIVDIGMDGGEQLIEQALKLRSDLKVLAFSDVDDIHKIRLAFSLGAHAYLLKKCLEEELLLAIKCAQKNRRYICSGIASLFPLEKLMEPTCFGKHIECSDRETEILKLLEQGMTNKEISDRLFLSKRTVEGYRQQLLEKSGCRNTAQLISFAIRNGFL